MIKFRHNPISDSANFLVSTNHYKFLVTEARKRGATVGEVVGDAIVLHARHCMKFSEFVQLFPVEPEDPKR